ncbi:ABC transporter ATP-binding protein [Leptospira jelokensis]|uniref:ABC transporter ATP-binding protein n=1 Tax=Leptospira jelokensis TaxID=2484931 RepID=A0A4Z1ABH0_9LEPT|nr:ABC transporter ATP-binding protein [Leptospira jelokensis]TGL75604.1 ABC transporter ATP-binding protein [Leptospira jelokensis]
MDQEKKYSESIIAIKVKNLKKTFFQENLTIPILNGISFQIPEKQMVTLMGPSGSGKSTLLNILSSVERPTEGSVKIFGEELVGATEAKLTEYRRNRIGIVFQFFHLFPYLSAIENVSLPLLIAGKNRKSAEQKASDLLNLVGLGERLHFSPKEMSGGEKQRVSIARAMIHDPKIIFADEPTGNLDSKSSNMIMEIFNTCSRKLGITIFLVTHNEEIGKSGDVNYRMLDGAIIQK